MHGQEKIYKAGEAIYKLRDERSAILMKAAQNKEKQDRINDLIAFLKEQTEAVTKYSEELVRRLVEKVMVYNEKIVVEFKSGLQVEVDA